VIEDLEFKVEQFGLAICLSLMGAAVATKILLHWFDRDVNRAFNGGLR
jgi:hypothetical protein